MKSTRRLAILVTLLGCMSFAEMRAYAQSGPVRDPNRTYSDVFRAAPGSGLTGDAQVPTATATGVVRDERSGPQTAQESDYARVYQAFRGVQERRTAVPADPMKRKAHIKALRTAMAVPDDAVPGVKFLLTWNHVALDATAMDHNTLSGSFQEQFGPTRTSRALAIVHLAMFEAVNTISRKHPSYQNIQQEVLGKVGLPAAQVTPDTASIDRAIVEAAFQTLSALYPRKSDFLVESHAQDRTLLGDIPNAAGNRPPKMILGERVGAEAARSVLDRRKNDRSKQADPPAAIFETDDPLDWRRDPITKLLPALGGNWRNVRPFLIASADAFRPGSSTVPSTLPAVNSPEFIAAYKEVKRLGGDPHALITEDRFPTPTDRTGADNPNDPNPPDNTNQTFVGIFWGYDGTALLCAPPRLYNMIATSVALKERKIANVEDMAQYLALINLAMADAGISAWDAKFHFLIARPVTYIRAADADGTPEGARNPRWTPLGAPVTNGTDEGRNLTPPFPTYPSGHATFGGALFQAMIEYFKDKNMAEGLPPFPDDGIAFDFVSDEYNGLNRGPGEEAPRKKVETHFTSFRDAEHLNAYSRLYLGIHWKFDADDGIKQGNEVAKDVFKKFVKPTP